MSILGRLEVSWGIYKVQKWPYYMGGSAKTMRVLRKRILSTLKRLESFDMIIVVFDFPKGLDYRKLGIAV